MKSRKDIHRRLDEIRLHNKDILVETEIETLEWVLEWQAQIKHQLEKKYASAVFADYTTIIMKE